MLSHYFGTINVRIPDEPITATLMILSVLKSLSLGIWLGALLMLGIAVAGPIFRLSESKTLAGSINQVILAKMNGIEWACAIAAFGASVILLWLNWGNAGRSLRIAETATLAVMVAILFYYSSIVSGRMDTLRERIGDFDHPKTNIEYVTAKAEFDQLHKRYTKLVGANMILILVTFTLDAISRRSI